MKYEIKKINLLTMAVYSGLFYGLIGLVPLVFGIGAFVGQALRDGFRLQFLAFLLFPFGFFAVGMLLGAVFALIYNKVAEQWVGFKIDIDYHQEDEDKNK